LAALSGGDVVNFPEEWVEEPESTPDRSEEKALDIARRFKIGLSLCMAYKGNKDLALWCFAQAMGFTDLTSAETDVEISKRFKVTKQNVVKCKMMFQERMGIEPLAAQRSNEARERMRAARKKQLNQTI